MKRFKNLRSLGEIQEDIPGVYFKGGSKSSTTTQPSPEQRAILNKQLNLANRLERGGKLNFFPGDTLGNESAETLQGREAQLAAAGQIGDLNPNVLDAVNRGLNADLVSDPRTQAAANAATRPLEQQFFEQVLPGISSAAQSQGAFGGDRAALLNAQAGRDFTQTVGDVRAKIFADAHRTGLQSQQATLAQLPQVQQGLLTPSQAIQDVGQQQDARSQAEVDAERERFEFKQLGLTDLVNRVNAPLSGINFGQVTTSKSGGGK